MQVAGTTEARPGQLELRLPIDGTEGPFAYPDTEGCLALEVALHGGGYANLVLATADARNWAGEAFAAVSAAYREATGDPHALSDDELAVLPPAEVYHPGPGAHFCAEGEGPAVVRFHIEVDVQGECLDAGPLRAGLVEVVTDRFDTVRVAISEGFAIAGRAS